MEPIFPIYPLADVQKLFIDSRVSRGHSPQTVDRYNETFRDFTRYITETESDTTTAILTLAGIRGFGTWLREPNQLRPKKGHTHRSVHSVHGRLRDMKAFTRWLVEEELLQKAPKIELPKLPEELFPILTNEQLQTLFKCPQLSSTGDAGIRNRAIIFLMLDTGIRLGEAAGLTPADIELGDCLMTVTGKGSKTRRVPFSDGVGLVLREWLAIRGDEPGDLFWLSAAGIQSLFVRMRKETGLPVHPHLLRHQAATMLVRNHADIHTVKRLLGHSSITVTEKYLSMSTQDLQDKHRASSPYESLRELVTPVAKKPARRRLSLT